MSERISITPIQRNTNDVAIELTQLYLQHYYNGVENLEDIYARFYALAKYLSAQDGARLVKFIPNDIYENIIK